MVLFNKNKPELKSSSENSNFKLSELKLKIFIFCDNILFLLLTFSMHSKYLSHPEVLIFICVNILAYLYSIVKGYKKGKFFNLDEILKTQNFIVLLFIGIYTLFFYFFSIVVCLIILYKQLLGEIPIIIGCLSDARIFWGVFLILIISFGTLCRGCKFLIKNRRCNNPNKNFIENEIFDLQLLLVTIYFICLYFFFLFDSVYFNTIFVGLYIVVDIFLPVIFLKRAKTNKNTKMRLYLNFKFKNVSLIGCYAVILVCYFLHELASANVSILPPLFLKFD